MLRCLVLNFLFDIAVVLWGQGWPQTYWIPSASASFELWLADQAIVSWFKNKQSPRLIRLVILEKSIVEMPPPPGPALDHLWAHRLDRYMKKLVTFLFLCKGYEWLKSCLFVCLFCCIMIAPLLVSLVLWIDLVSKKLIDIVLSVVVYGIKANRQTEFGARKIAWFDKVLAVKAQLNL